MAVFVATILDDATSPQAASLAGGGRGFGGFKTSLPSGMKIMENSAKFNH